MLRGGRFSQKIFHIFATIALGRTAPKCSSSIQKLTLLQAATGPCPAEVGAHVKSRPVVGRRCDRSFVGRGLGGQVSCKSRRAEQSDGSDARKQEFSHAPVP
jgi:hypothetical protein